MMADNTVHIVFYNATVNTNNLDGNNSAEINGTIDIDYTTNKVTGTLTVTNKAGSETYSSFTISQDASDGVNSLSSFGNIDPVHDTMLFSYHGERPNSVTDLLIFKNGEEYSTNGNVPVTSDSTACYCVGTRILTTVGEIAIEDLRVGDLVITSSGARRAIKWLGHRRVCCRCHPRPHECRPVRISAHAFGLERPSRDLWVSPGHSISVDMLGEVLVPSFSVINGTTIQQVDVDEATYWHVELDSHDIIFAENMPAESYLEMGNRTFFEENAVVELDANPDAEIDTSTSTHADFCRPLHVDGPLVEAVRHQLNAIALRAGWRLDGSDPFAGLHLLVDGVRIDPICRDLIARFTVPVEAQDVWLISKAARPRDIINSQDVRHLGVSIGSLTIDDGFAQPRAIDLADPRLCVGFHALEDGTRRWTAERALLPAELWDHCRSDFFLRVDLAGPALPRWLPPAEHMLKAIPAHNKRTA